LYHGSLGYCHGKYRIIAVLEPLRNHSIWDIGGFYVVPDPKDVVIRYLEEQKPTSVFTWEFPKNLDQDSLQQAVSQIQRAV